MAQPFKDHFSTRSGDYAQYRPGYPLALIDYLAGLAPGRDLALDCGCGTGQLSVLLAEAFSRVMATDASPQQIENATPHERIDYRVAPAAQSGLPEASADLITVAQAAHWFDLDAFYAEVGRVLKPQGVIALITYGVIKTDGEVGRILDDFYYHVIGPYWPPERRHVEAGYQTLAFPFAEITPPDLAMTAEWSLSEVLGYVDTWSAVRGAEAALGRAPYEQFCAALTTAWGDPTQRQTIGWPLSLRVGRV